MFVIKRNGKRETLNVDKIYRRIEVMTPGLKVKDKQIRQISKQVFSQCYEDILTRDVDGIILRVLGEKIDGNKQLDKLATRLAVSNLHRDTRRRFSSSMKLLHDNKKIDDEEYDIIKENKESLDNIIVCDRDFDFDFKTFQELSKKLESVEGRVVERIQYYVLRHALHMWKSDIDHMIEEYHKVSCDRDLVLSCMLSHV